MDQSLQTGRQTKTAQKPSPRQEQQQQQSSRELDSATLALQALLSGAPLEHVSQPGLAACARQMGNSALLELLEHRDTGPELADYHPPDTPLDTPPLVWARAPLELVPAPQFTPGETGGGYAQGE